MLAATSRVNQSCIVVHESNGINCVALTTDTTSVAMATNNELRNAVMMYDQTISSFKFDTEMLIIYTVNMPETTPSN